jgi:hypothetical protein
VRKRVAADVGADRAEWGLDRLADVQQGAAVVADPDLVDAAHARTGQRSFGHLSVEVVVDAEAAVDAADLDRVDEAGGEAVVQLQGRFLGVWGGRMVRL